MTGYEAYLWKPWINHSKNAVLGLTITVPASTGVLVVAALAVLVSLAGGAAWSIISYTLYQIRASSNSKDLLHRIHQVQLRNARGPASSAWELMKSGYVYNDGKAKAKLRACGLALWPLIINVGFMAASVFVAKVTVAAHKTNVILLKPSTCGLEGYALGQVPGQIKAIDPQWSAKHANDSRESRAYVDRCYETANGTLGCSQLPVQRLPFSSRNDALCPFQGLCTLGRNSALQLDTGELDSHDYLGINARASDRLNFRMTTTCSVLRIADYINVTTDPGDHFGTTRSVEVKLGPIGPTNNPVINYTWYYNTVMSIQQLSYQVATFLHTPINLTDGTGWQPIPELDIADGDVTLIIIAPNNVMYKAPSFDPMFTANGTWTYVDSESITWIKPDYAFSAMGCVDRVQICNPTKAICSPSVGPFQALGTNILALGLNDAQLATAWRIVFALTNSHIQESVGNLGVAALAVSEMLTGNLFSPGLPDNQWIRETRRWFQTSLANLQHRIVDYPNNVWSQNLTDQWGSTGIEFGVMPFEALNEEPDGRVEALRNQCGNQIVRSTGDYQSFVLIGIIIVVLVSFALIVTSWTLPWCVDRKKGRRPEGKKRYKLEAYDADANAEMARVLQQRVQSLDSGVKNLGKSAVEREETNESAQASVEERGFLLRPPLYNR